MRKELRLEREEKKLMMEEMELLRSRHDGIEGRMRGEKIG